MSALATEDMSAVETGQMSAVETRQMSVLLSCVNTQCSSLRRLNCGNVTMFKSQIGGLALNR